MLTNNPDYYNHQDAKNGSGSHYEDTIQIIDKTSPPDKPPSTLKSGEHVDINDNSEKEREFQRMMMLVKLEEMSALPDVIHSLPYQLLLVSSNLRSRKVMATIIKAYLQMSITSPKRREIKMKKRIKHELNLTLEGG